ncbi:MAG: sigma-70 family RNA polymerase sigma factor [Candidatus Delongbacteria bacterium]|nr:sigma-70 family RNA polymerase sigma factor [Candidatus Delongbacteria bacterium]
MNNEQFTNLVTRHSDDLYNYACYMLRNSEDAADVIQETFLRCWQQREQLQPGLEKNWLWRVICHQCLDLLRRRQRMHKRFQRLEPDRLAQLPGIEQEQESAYDLQHKQQQLQTALADLPARSRSIMLLRYFDDLDYEQIAGIMQLRPGAVRTIAHRARRKLQLKLSPETA